MSYPVQIAGITVWITDELLQQAAEENLIAAALARAIARSFSEPTIS